MLSQRLGRALVALQRRGAHGAAAARLKSLEEGFVAAVAAHAPKSGAGLTFATAWLATDNIVVHLLHKHFPELFQGFSLLAVDTLHLFPSTLAVAAEVQAKYGKTASVFRPVGCATRADFVARYGDCEVINHADFDLHSKVEPYKRGLEALKSSVLITGRRSDQGEKRITLDAWEPQPRILNPMAAWLWPDVTAFVDAHGVPVNGAHNFAYRAQAPIPATQRHREDLPWQRVDLGKPFWRASPAEVSGGAPVAYVFKSFGDTHTSVPVLPHESERTGRFVRTANTECGIHTRVAKPGAPHGGKLVDLLTGQPPAAELLASATARHDLTERQSCDLELLMNGGFSPLTGFHTKAEYDSVLAHQRLPEQQLWAMPVVLDSSDSAVAKVGARVALYYKGAPCALLEVESVWAADKAAEAHAVFGTSSVEHPGVLDLVANRGAWYLGGRVRGIALPAREMPCATPAQVRAGIAPGAAVVAFQCRNPIHRAHFELIRRVLDDVPGCRVLIHPTVGPTQPDDIDGLTRVATYQALEKEVGSPRLKWAFLPFNMRMAGPREALQHMLIRKNFGATHFIVGRDMAGTKSTRTSEDFYGPFDAQTAVKAHAGELAMKVVTCA
jgi:sulfate adenylyltransferase